MPQDGTGQLTWLANSITDSLGCSRPRNWKRQNHKDRMNACHENCARRLRDEILRTKRSLNYPRDHARKQKT